MSLLWVLALAAFAYAVGRLHEGCKQGGTVDLEEQVRFLDSRLRLAREQTAQAWSAAHEASIDAVRARTSAGTAWPGHHGLRAARPVGELDSNVVEFRRALHRGSAS